MKTKKKTAKKVITTNKLSYGKQTKIIPLKAPCEGLPKYECRFCGYDWIPRINVPVECPRCRGRDWWKFQLNKRASNV